MTRFKHPPLWALAPLALAGAAFLPAGSAHAAGVKTPIIGDPVRAAPDPSGPTYAQRSAAAAATANSASNPCDTVKPFYWEVGDKSAKQASGSVAGVPTKRIPNPPQYTSTTLMPVASATKMIFGAYALELAKDSPTGVLSASDIQLLTLTGGYNSFDDHSCDQTDTVASCFARAPNNVQTAAAVGKFYYGGGNLQKEGMNLGMGPQKDGDLAADLRKKLGFSAAGMVWATPQLGGGFMATPDVYGAFLRRLLSGQYAMLDQLGAHAVCANPLTCPTALYWPGPADESWSYSLAHWVENDPKVGDGAFSSPGSFGFYPWVDASKTYYGILARKAQEGSGFESATCGRLIRKAWVTGVAQ